MRIALPRLTRLRAAVAACAVVSTLTLLAGPAQAAVQARTSTAAVERQVKEALKANPGSRRISATSVLLAPGVVMTVPGPVKAGTTMTIPTDGGGQLTVLADTSCPYQWLCMWQDIYRGSAKIAFYKCTYEWMADYYFYDAHTGVTRNWRDQVSSIWNNQSGGAVSKFYNWKYYTRFWMGSLSAGNYLQDLTRNVSAEGGTWNDKIDEVRVC